MVSRPIFCLSKIELFQTKAVSGYEFLRVCAIVLELSLNILAQEVS